MIIKITERQYRKLIGENLRISQEEMRDKLEQITDWDDCVKLIADYYDNKIPIFHATTPEHEPNIANKGFIPVDYRNRTSWGGEQGYYFQIGYSSYVDDDRSVLFKAEINPNFFLSHVLVDTDSIMSPDEASEVLGWNIEEYVEESDAQEFIAAVVSNDFELDGIEFYVIDSSEPEPIPATRVNEGKYKRF